jgi:hypothetical protein
VLASSAGLRIVLTNRCDHWVPIDVNLVDDDSWWSILSRTSLDGAPSGSAGRRADGAVVADRWRHRFC